MLEIGRANRLQVMMTDDEMAAIDDYQFSTRLTSRAEAVRELIRVGRAARGDRVEKESN
jgi:hypothetical protein